MGAERGSSFVYFEIQNLNFYSCRNSTLYTLKCRIKRLDKKFIHINFYSDEPKTNLHIRGSLPRFRSSKEESFLPDNRPVSSSNEIVKHTSEIFEILFSNVKLRPLIQEQLLKKIVTSRLAAKELSAGIITAADWSQWSLLVVDDRSP